MRVCDAHCIDTERRTGRMRRTAIGLTLLAAAGLGGCGSAGTFANKPRPATTVNLSVYVNDRRVSISPAEVGAGPVLFIVTNQASNNEALDIRDGTGRALATTGPINPGGTAQVQVDFRSGDYELATRAPGLVRGPAIHPARLRIGRPRASADNVLLAP
jgi:hypothetical protein